MNRKLLMCSPNNFDVVYKINPWMDPEKEVDQVKAVNEWERVKDIYISLGLDLEIIDSIEGLPDMVFAANGFFAMNNKAVLANFRFPQRRGETKYFKDYLKSKGFLVFNEDEVIYEGEGDTLVGGNYIFQGWGFRSDKEICEVMRTTFPEKEIVPLRLTDERFYHMDTCFFPVSEDLVFLYEKSFDETSIKMLKDKIKEVVFVSDEEALTFCLNSILVNETVVTNGFSKKFLDRLKSFGFKIISADTGEYIKSGGSVKCLTNEIW